MSTMYGRHEIHTLEKMRGEKNERRNKKSDKGYVQTTDWLQKKGISGRHYHGIFRLECIQSRTGDGMGKRVCEKRSWRNPERDQMRG